MSYLLSIYVFFSNIFLRDVINRKLVLFVSLLILAVFFGGIYNQADDFYYRFSYQQLAKQGASYTGGIDIGWLYFQLLLINLGVSFEGFRFVIGIVGIALIGQTIMKLSQQFNFVIILYFIFPFILDVIQIRNFLGSALLIYSFQFLVKDQKFKSLIFILLASSIHSLIILFIPFIFLYHFSLRKTFTFGAVATPILIMLTSTLFFQSILKIFADDSVLNKISGYLNKAGSGFLFLWSMQLTFVLLIYGIYRSFKLKFPQKASILNFIELVLKLNIFTIIISFPLIIFDGNFTRMFRDIMILNYIVISYSFMLDKSDRLKYIIFGCLLVIWYFYGSVSYGTNTQTVLIPFFENNFYLEEIDNLF